MKRRQPAAAWTVAAYTPRSRSCRRGFFPFMLWARYAIPRMGRRHRRLVFSLFGFRYIAGRRRFGEQVLRAPVFRNAELLHNMPNVKVDCRCVRQLLIRCNRFRHLPSTRSFLLEKHLLFVSPIDCHYSRHPLVKSVITSVRCQTIFVEFRCALCAREEARSSSRSGHFALIRRRFEPSRRRAWVCRHAPPAKVGPAVMGIAVRYKGECACRNRRKSDKRGRQTRKAASCRMNVRPCRARLRDPGHGFGVGSESVVTASGLPNGPQFPASSIALTVNV